MVDLSYENYAPPVGDVDREPSKEEIFLSKVNKLANEMGLEFVVATRDGKYSANINESLVLKEIFAKVVEINGRPENIKMNN